jgi:hypothetical protein
LFKLKVDGQVCNILENHHFGFPAKVKMIESCHLKDMFSRRHLVTLQINSIQFKGPLGLGMSQDIFDARVLSVNSVPLDAVLWSALILGQANFLPKIRFFKNYMFSEDFRLLAQLTLCRYLVICLEIKVRASCLIEEQKFWILRMLLIFLNLYVCFDQV